MQLEAGKHYRTRDGRKAFVAGVATDDEVSAGSLRAVGWIAEAHLETWSKGGCYYHREGTNHPHDLVAEWKEPVTLEGTLRLMRQKKDGTIQLSVCPSSETNQYWELIAKRSTCHQCGAKYRIVEGEGMDDA